MKNENKSESAPAPSGAIWIVKHGGLGNCWLEDAQGSIILEFRDTTSETERNIIASAPDLLAERDRLKRCLRRTLAGLPGCVSHGEYYTQVIIADIRSTLEGRAL